MKWRFSNTGERYGTTNVKSEEVSKKTISLSILDYLQKDDMDDATNIVAIGWLKRNTMGVYTFVPSLRSWRKTSQEEL